MRIAYSSLGRRLLRQILKVRNQLPHAAAYSALPSENRNKGRGNLRRGTREGVSSSSKRGKGGNRQEKQTRYGRIGAGVVKKYQGRGRKGGRENSGPKKENELRNLEREKCGVLQAKSADFAGYIPDEFQKAGSEQRTIRKKCDEASQIAHF